MEWNLFYVVKVLDPEGETVTHGSMYKFAMLKSLEISHLGKLSYVPIGETNSVQTCSFGKRTDEATLVRSLRDITVVLSDIL